MLLIIEGGSILCRWTWRMIDPFHSDPRKSLPIKGISFNQDWGRWDVLRDVGHDHPSHFTYAQLTVTYAHFSGCLVWSDHSVQIPLSRGPSSWQSGCFCPRPWHTSSFLQGQDGTQNIPTKIEDRILRVRPSEYLVVVHTCLWNSMSSLPYRAHDDNDDPPLYPRC